MDRRNTHTKPRHSGFGSGGCTRLFEALVLPLIAANGRVARVDSRRETLSELAIRDVGDQVARVPGTGTRRPFEYLAIPLIQRLFSPDNGFKTECCNDRLNQQIFQAEITQ
jgi:hypothetical protein